MQSFSGCYKSKGVNHVVWPGVAHIFKKEKKIKLSTQGRSLDAQLRHSSMGDTGVISRL